MQEKRNPIANALELRLSCTNPSKYKIVISGNKTSPWFASHDSDWF